MGYMREVAYLRQQALTSWDRFSQMYRWCDEEIMRSLLGLPPQRRKWYSGNAHQRRTRRRAAARTGQDRPPSGRDLARLSFVVKVF